jgi:uncharacterized membrane protein YhaH (DUF805 family)
MDWRHLFLEFDGRIGRKTYWIALGILLIGFIVAIIVESWFDNARLSAIISLALLYPDMAITVKRAHDRDMGLTIIFIGFALSFLLSLIQILGLAGPPEQPSGLLLLITLPLLPITLYLFVVLGFFRGTRGPNRHGADPLERQT